MYTGPYPGFFFEGTGGRAKSPNRESGCSKFSEFTPWRRSKKEAQGGCGGSPRPPEDGLACTL